MADFKVAPNSIDDADLDRAIDAIAAARVGGNYWGAQPTLPRSPYKLVRVRDAQPRHHLLGSLGADGPVVCWVDDASEMSSSGSNVAWMTGHCDPWHAASRATAVISDHDDDLVLVAALSGLKVDDPKRRPLAVAGSDRAERRDLARDRLAGCAYADPFSGETFGLFDAIELSAFWRQMIDSNRDITAAIGFASWKRPTAAPLLWNGSTEVPFTARPRGRESGGSIAAWKSRVDPVLLTELEDEGAHVIEVEDGFIRSVGLGADCVPPLSLVVDRLGAYFDPQRPSELEQLLQGGTFSADLLDRAQRLRRLIVEAGVSKYGVGGSPIERRAGSRRHLLVPGQVEDDRSVLCGGGAIRTNLDLLLGARREAPDAHIIYKPHPDVEAGHRVGAIARARVAEFADEIVADEPISSLIDMVDEVHVNTSLAGFEALMRGKPVTAHGVPFYAGWGLTRDLGAVPARRTATRTLDELVAAVLLLYPRYLDPVTGLPCTPEVLVRRLAEGAGSGRDGPLVPLRRVQGFVKRRLSSWRAR